MAHFHSGVSVEIPILSKKILDTIGRNEGGGAQSGKRRLMIPLRKSTFIPVNPYIHRHFERWQGNWIRREPQATENPVTRFPSGGSMLSGSALKIATATMSREISQINDYDGVTTPEDIDCAGSAAL